MYTNFTVMLFEYSADQFKKKPSFKRVLIILTYYFLAGAAGLASGAALTSPEGATFATVASSCFN